jgi:hypothetical protein
VMAGRVARKSPRLKLSCCKMRGAEDGMGAEEGTEDDE